MSVTLLGLKQVARTAGTQSRERMDKDHAVEFADWLREHPDRHLAPVKVVSDAKRFWLWDGFHRFDGYTLARRTEIPADVTRGTLRDAILLSASANTDIVLKRTPADKRNAVELLLMDSEWCDWSDTKIADHCGVERHFVAKVRSAYLGSTTKIAEPTARTVQRGDGAPFKMEVAAIGRRAAPAREPENHAAAAAPRPAPPAARITIALTAALCLGVDRKAVKANLTREQQMVQFAREATGIWD